MTITTPPQLGRGNAVTHVPFCLFDCWQNN